MATKPTSRRTVTAKHKGPDPAGRVDILVIRLLQKAVEVYGDLPLRGVYGSYRKQINRIIRRHLGKVRFHMDGFGRVQVGGPNVR